MSSGSGELFGAVADTGTGSSGAGSSGGYYVIARTLRLAVAISMARLNRVAKSWLPAMMA